MHKWRKPFIGTALWAAIVLTGYFGYSYAQDQRFIADQKQREEIRKGLSYAEDLSIAFRQVGKLVEPTVVNIAVIRKAPAIQRMPLDEDMLRKFFPDRDGDGEPDVPEGFLPHGLSPEDEEFIPQQMGTGSGVIMDAADGKAFVLTNNHVVGGAEEMIITLHDGRRIRNAKLVGTDPKSDLAVVQIDADRVFTAKWGNSDELQKGDWIMAFGSPFNFVGSMTHGIVSALNRQTDILGQYGYENFIQVDAPINPGNSGGPLVNLKGEVVGINTAIASRSGGFQGIGFAIPSNQAKFVYSALREKGRVVRGWLGVAIRDIAEQPGLAESFGYDKRTGVLVHEAMPNTPATGKLQKGDIIAEINGKAVDTTQQLRNTIAAIAPGTETKLRVFRNGKYETVAITLGEQPEQMTALRQPDRQEQPQPPEQTTAEALGIRVQTVTPQLAQSLRVDVRAGAAIMSVNRNSLAARHGLRPGDVITELGDKRINTADDLINALKGADLKKGIRLYVVSRDGSRYMFVQAD